jgi:hypothetical protein
MCVSRRNLIIALLALVATDSLAGPALAQQGSRQTPMERRREEERKREEAARVRRQLARPEDAKLIRDAAWAASVIYSHENKTKTSAEAGLRTDLVAKGLLANPHVTYVRNQGTYQWDYYVAWDGSTVYLVFRGGKGTTIQKSIFVGAIPNPFNGSHTGIGVAHETIRADVERLLTNAGARNKRLIIVGHSMGGMMAGITAWNLINNSVPVHAVVTFAAPRYGDGNFERSFETLANRRGVKVYSVENSYDPNPTAHTPFTQSRIGRNIDMPFRERKDSLVNHDPHSERGYYDYAQLVLDYINEPPLGLPIGRPGFPGGTPHQPRG